MKKLTLEKIEKNISYWQSVKRAWEKQVDAESDFNTFVYSTYLHTCSVTNTAEIVNDAGFRKNGIKYKSTDISDIIRNTDIDNKDLQTACRNIIDSNTKVADMIYN